MSLSTTLMRARNSSLGHVLGYIFLAISAYSSSQMPLSRIRWALVAFDNFASFGFGFFTVSIYLLSG
jgi:hypothetical protein